MKNYMYEPMWSQEIEDMIESGDLTEVKPLVEEMFYKYGLQVYDIDILKRKVYMTLDGLPYCDVSAETNNDGGITYLYRSDYYAKERGRDFDDRHTFYSNKLSSLMKALEKKGAVATSTEDALNYNLIGATIRQLEQGIKNTSKSAWDMDAGHMHEMLKVYFGEIDKSDISEESIKHCKVILDTYNKADDNKRHRQERIDSFVANGLYVIGKDYGSGYIMGKISMSKDKDNRTITVIEEPFHRVKSISESTLFSNLSGVIPLIKVYFEQRKGSYSFMGDESDVMIPVTDHYFEDLDVCTTYKTSLSRYVQIWLMIPA